MAPKAFLILGILFFLMAIPSMKSESQMVNDSSRYEAAQKNSTDGGTAPSPTPVPPKNDVGGPVEENLPRNQNASKDIRSVDKKYESGNGRSKMGVRGSHSNSARSATGQSSPSQATPTGTSLSAHIPGSAHRYFPRVPMFPPREAHAL